MPGNSSSGLLAESVVSEVVETVLSSSDSSLSTSALDPAMLSSFASRAAKMMFLSGPVLVFFMVPNMSARLSRTVTPDALSSAPL